MSIYVTCHGETLDSMTDCLAGPNAALTALGEDQARQVAEDLAGKLALTELTRIITSPRVRTVRTAAIIADFFGLTGDAIQEDRRLQERDLKSFIGQRRKQVFALAETQLEAGGAELLKHFTARNQAAYNEALESEHEATLLVTHRGNLTPLFEAAHRSLPTVFPATQALLLHD